MRTLAAVCGVALLLAGCATVEAPAPGLSPEQVDEIRHAVIDLRWAQTGLYADQRPANPHVTVVSEDDWIDAYSKCMLIRGSGETAAVQVLGAATITTGSDQDSETWRLNDFVCASSFEVDGQFDAYFNEAQMDYVFDYFRDFLVPCLALHNFAVVTTPTRSEFVHGWGRWHPYFALDEASYQALIGEPDLPLVCPPMPVGVHDQRFALVGE